MAHRVIETVGELKEWLAGYSDDCKIEIGSTLGFSEGAPLTFFRLRPWGEKHVILELQELYEPGEWEEIKRRKKWGRPEESES